MSDSYGMFTKQGNKRIAKILAPLQADPRHSEVMAVIEEYLEFAYHRAPNTMKEASDTAVREAVFSDVMAAVGEWGIADTLWKMADDRVFNRGAAARRPHRD